MATIKLRNGSTVEEAIVSATYLSLELLWNTEPITASELAQCANDPQYRAHGNTGATMVELRLAERVNEDGTVVIHNAIRDIILSTYKGEGFSLYMVAPVTS